MLFACQLPWPYSIDTRRGTAEYLLVLFVLQSEAIISLTHSAHFWFLQALYLLASGKLCTQLYSMLLFLPAFSYILLPPMYVTGITQNLGLFENKTGNPGKVWPSHSSVEHVIAQYLLLYSEPSRSFVTLPHTSWYCLYCVGEIH